MSSTHDFDAAVIFSLLDGHVWVSWPGASEAVKLGPHESVAEIMEDFLAQCQLGERLASRVAEARGLHLNQDGNRHFYQEFPRHGEQTTRFAQRRER